MSILCGTDFSSEASSAMAAAACIASRMRLPLHLLHATPQVNEGAGTAHSLAGSAESRLQRRASWLRRLTPEVHMHVAPTTPEHALAELAQQLDARMIVIGTHDVSTEQHGSAAVHASRVAASAGVPVLVVRHASAFEAWAREDRPLRVLFGAGGAGTGRAGEVPRWVAELATHGPIEVIATHLYDAHDERTRLGFVGASDNELEAARLLDVLGRELREAWEDMQLPDNLQVRLAEVKGSKAGQLARIAREEHADLIVVGTAVGTHQVRPWKRSTSELLLEAAQSCIACVPTVPGSLPVTSAVESVLVATDLSAPAEAAVSLASHVVAPHGTVHLVHVLPNRALGPANRDIFEPVGIVASTEAPRAEERLRSLASVVDISRGAHVEAHVLEARDTAEAICQAAERLDVDLICLATRHRTRLSKALLGSVAAGVVRHASRPVLLSFATHS